MQDNPHHILLRSCYVTSWPTADRLSVYDNVLRSLAFGLKQVLVAGINVGNGIADAGGACAAAIPRVIIPQDIDAQLFGQLPAWGRCF